MGKLIEKKTVVVPKKHSLTYDYRYIKGRKTGNWTVEIIDSNKKYKTSFYLEKYN